MIMKLKQEFYFNYKSKQIKVQKLNTVYCAIFGDVAKPLVIDIYTDENRKANHIGEIRNKSDNKFLSFIPRDAIEGNDKKRETHAKLIKRHNLPKWCEICLLDNVPLEVHHVIEHAESGNDSKENLRVYCSSCHNIVHAIRTSTRHAIKKGGSPKTLTEIRKELNNKTLN